MVIWMIGLSASGKSTICQTVYDLLKPIVPSLVFLEGERLRTVLGDDLRHSKSDRLKAMKRLQAMVEFLAKENIPLLTACVWTSDETLAWNRENIPEYFEVYMKVVMETVIGRDPRGIYKRALSGDVPNVVGMDIPFNEPKHPDMVVDCDSGASPTEMAMEVIRQATNLRQFLPRDRWAEFWPGTAI